MKQLVLKRNVEAITAFHSTKLFFKDLTGSKNRRCSFGINGKRCEFAKSSAAAWLVLSQSNTNCASDKFLPFLRAANSQAETQ